MIQIDILRRWMPIPTMGFNYNTLYAIANRKRIIFLIRAKSLNKYFKRILSNFQSSQKQQKSIVFSSFMCHQCDRLHRPNRNSRVLQIRNKLQIHSIHHKIQIQRGNPIHNNRWATVKKKKRNENKLLPEIVSHNNMEICFTVTASLTKWFTE